MDAGLPSIAPFYAFARVPSGVLIPVARVLDQILLGLLKALRLALPGRGERPLGRICDPVPEA